VVNAIRMRGVKGSGRTYVGGRERNIREECSPRFYSKGENGPSMVISEFPRGLSKAWFLKRGRSKKKERGGHKRGRPVGKKRGEEKP